MHLSKKQHKKAPEDLIPIKRDGKISANVPKHETMGSIFLHKSGPSAMHTWHLLDPRNSRNACHGRFALLVARNNDVTLSMVTIFWSCSLHVPFPFPSPKQDENIWKSWRYVKMTDQQFSGFPSTIPTSIFLNFCEHIVLRTCVPEYLSKLRATRLHLYLLFPLLSLHLSCISLKSSSALAKLRALAHASMACDSSHFPGWAPWFILLQQKTEMSQDKMISLVSVKLGSFPTDQLLWNWEQVGIWKRTFSWIEFIWDWVVMLILLTDCQFKASLFLGIFGIHAERLIIDIFCFNHTFHRRTVDVSEIQTKLSHISCAATFTFSQLLNNIRISHQQ